MEQPPQEMSDETPWKTVLDSIDSLRTDVLENNRQIIEGRAESKGYYEDI